ncbi:hypothetical protein KC901_00030 [Patescibacteria group bacterium]|nr:hypothetical protein [Patescibacteria group bacterium]
MDGIKRKKRTPKTTRTSQPRSLSEEQHVADNSDVVGEQKKKKCILQQSKHITPEHHYVRIQKIVRARWTHILLRFVVVMGALMLIANHREKTTIDIRPHLEYVALDRVVRAERNPQEGELGFEIVALSDEVSLPVTASSERAVERYASGEVTVVNDYSSEPQRLVVGTRFESASGKIFMLDDDVIVPGKTGEEKGTLTVNVHAKDSGESYNIDSTDFTLPGFKEAGLTEKYNRLYAFSQKPFDGGFVGTEPYIGDEESLAYEHKAQNMLLDRLSLRLEKEKTDKLLLIQKSIQVQYRDAEFIIDESGTTGILTTKGTIFALAVGRDNLENFINQQTFPEHEAYMIAPRDLQVLLNGTSIDFEHQQAISVTVSGSPMFSWYVDESLVKKTLRGVHFSDLPYVFELMPSVDRAHTDVRPFWKNRVSSNINRIVVHVQ